MTHSRSDVASLLEANGLSPRRAFGQNFVVDPNIVRKIARLSGVGPGDHVVEIGAGLGSLTLALTETGANVVAVEIDNGVVEVLREVVAGCPNVEVVHADAGALDWSSLATRSTTWHVVANLPYNVATPLVADILDDVPVVRHLLVMVQREVAERFVAQPRTSAYGAVSVKVAYWSHARIVADVPATVFLPKPNVASALVEFTRRDVPAVDGVEPKELFALVRAGFAQRRKMLRRSLAGIVSSEQFERAGVASDARPEELDVESWGRLCRAVHE